MKYRALLCVVQTNMSECEITIVRIIMIKLLHVQVDLKISV